MRGLAEWQVRLLSLRMRAVSRGARKRRRKMLIRVRELEDGRRGCKCEGTF